MIIVLNNTYVASLPIITKKRVVLQKREKKKPVNLNKVDIVQNYPLAREKRKKIEKI